MINEFNLKLAAASAHFREGQWIWKGSENVIARVSAASHYSSGFHFPPNYEVLGFSIEICYYFVVRTDSPTYQWNKLVWAIGQQGSRNRLAMNRLILWLCEKGLGLGKGY